MKFLIWIGSASLVAVACGGSNGTPLLGDSGPSADSGPGGSDAAQDGDSQVVDAAGDAKTMCPDFCGGVKGALFCSDFDMETAPTDWSTTATTNGGTIAIQQSENVSCPNGLVASLPMIASASQTTTTTALVAKTIVTGSVIARLVLKVQAYLPSNDTQTYVTYFGLHATTDLTTGVYLTHHEDAYWFLSNVGGTINIGLNPSPLTGAFNDMTLDVEFGATGKVTFTYTGTDNAVHMVSGSGETAQAMATSVDADVGMLAFGNTEAAFQAYYDNIVITPAN
jgi:hypothetical protein